MIVELLLFLLPVAAASGWWAGARWRQTRIQKTTNEHNQDYFKGLNFLLNEQPDKALEVFIRMVQVDSDTVETHLALGNLFRRRGEVDRAIRIHQNLIARPNLEPQQRDVAVLELAHDYMRAGLLDRAENLFRELLDSSEYAVTAMQNLLAVYEREQEWLKAIDIARRLQKTNADPEASQILAHYCCELAELAWQHNDEPTAKAQLKRALTADPECSRAYMLEADIARAHQHYQQAVAAYQKIQTLDPELLPEVIEPLLDCLRATRDTQALEKYLGGLEQQNNAYSVIRAVTGLLRSTQAESRAETFFKDQLLRRPSLRGLRDWVQHEFARAEGKTRDAISVILTMLTQVIDSKPTYRCNRCGFAGQNLHWQCPSCHGWNTVKPIIGVEGE